MRNILKPVVLLALAAAPALATSCESLASLTLPHTTIRLAQTVKPGESGPPAALDPRRFRNLPGFCRVAAARKCAPARSVPIRRQRNTKARGTPMMPAVLMARRRRSAGRDAAQE
jgi:hypothetical protein